jgi:group II intron reverse transcriptase/maturase/CRISPR-associated endonuclease Cas1
MCESEPKAETAPSVDLARLCRPETLHEAWERVRLKNARGGIDGVSPGDLDTRIAKVLEKLSRQLEEGTYAPAPLERIKVPKFNAAGEWRRLSMPVVVDKIVQQAWVNLMAPVWEKEFLDVSYAYRPGKGGVKAIRRLEHCIGSLKLRWAAVADIDNFFDTLDRRVLLAGVGQKVNDPRLLDLVNLWLRAGFITGKGDFLDPDEGVAQGAVISPLLSNIYLHPMDRFAVDAEMAYVRYSDNFIVMAADRETAARSRESLQTFLETELALKLNAHPRPVAGLEEGFVFLGIYFKNDQRRMSNEKQAKTLKKLDWLTDRGNPAGPEQVLVRLNKAIASQKRYYGFLDLAEQFAAFDAHLEKRLPGLLAGFARRGSLQTGRQFDQWLEKLESYGRQSPDQRQAKIKRIGAKAVELARGESRPPPAARKGGGAQRPQATAPVAPPPAAQPENPQSGNPQPDGAQQTEAGKVPAPAKGAAARRLTVGQSRFLRQVGDEAEVLITSPGVFIGKTGERLILRKERQNIHEHPFAKIRQISVASPGVSLSSDVIWSCSQRKVPLAFVNPQGAAYAVLHMPVFPRGDLSVLQSRMHESPEALGLAGRILEAKSRNQMNVVKFYARHRSRIDPLFADRATAALAAMNAGVDQIRHFQAGDDFEKDRTALFTAEARISGHYWEIVKMLLPVELAFEKRTKKGAADVVNNMLNYGYGILYQRVWQAAVTVGFNPNIGFLHAFQKEKPVLIYDLVEEFRQALVDRPIFSLVTRGTSYKKLKVDAKTGLLDGFSRGKVLETVLHRLSGLIDYRGRKVRGEDVIGAQVRQLADVIQGKKNSYRGFITTY